jgi:cell division protein FtsL
MTPAVTTPAGKATRARVRHAAPAARPRRVSGPASGVPTVAGAARTAAPAPVFAPPRRFSAPPRRVSGPARRRPASARPRVTLGARAVAFLRALPDHSLLDRLIRGRVWIALLGVMLVGIVAMQVEVLKLGASMGRNIAQATTLQGHNEALRASVAALADDQRIEALAAKQGMVMPAPSDVAFLPVASSAVIQRAVSDIHAPAPAAFLTAATGNGAVTTLANAASAGALSGSGAGSTSSAASGSSASGPMAISSIATASTVTSAAPSAASATIPNASIASSSGN